jgi:hypothetical protein
MERVDTTGIVIREKTIVEDERGGKDEGRKWRSR